MTQKQKEVKPISDKEMALFREALIARFASELKPGETLLSTATRDSEHSIFALIIQSSDNSFRLEMEAALLAKDNEDISAEDRLLISLDFLEQQLEGFFDDRLVRFHDDWRIYDFKDGEIRFRGAQTNPELEALADQWIEKGE